MQAFDLLPNDIKAEILYYFNGLNLLLLRRVSKEWDKAILYYIGLKYSEYIKYEPGYLIKFGPEYRWYQQILLKSYIDKGNLEELKLSLEHSHVVISKCLALYARSKSDIIWKIVKHKIEEMDEFLVQFCGVYDKYYPQPPVTTGFMKFADHFLNEMDKNDYYLRRGEHPITLSHKRTDFIKDVIGDKKNRDKALSFLVQARIKFIIDYDDYTNIIGGFLRYGIIDDIISEKNEKLEDNYKAMFVLKFMRRDMRKINPDKFKEWLHNYLDKSPIAVEFLVKLGADVNTKIKDKEGPEATILIQAILQNNLNLVKKLLALGACPNEITFYQPSPLSGAIGFTKNKEIAKVIMEYGGKMEDEERKFLIIQYIIGNTPVNILELEESVHGTVHRRQFKKIWLNKNCI